MVNGKNILNFKEVRYPEYFMPFEANPIAAVQSPARLTTVWRRNNSKGVLFTLLERAE